MAVFSCPASVLVVFSSPASLPVFSNAKTDIRQLKCRRRRQFLLGGVQKAARRQITVRLSLLRLEWLQTDFFGVERSLRLCCVVETEAQYLNMVSVEFIRKCYNVQFASGVLDVIT